MVKIFLEFSEFGEKPLRIWPICNFQFFNFDTDLHGIDTEKYSHREHREEIRYCWVRSKRM